MRPAKNLIALAFPLFFLIACCTSTSHTVQAPHALVGELIDETVGIYQADSGVPTCTGVWVGERLILTAAHCIPEGKESIYFAVREEAPAVFVQPSRVHELRFVKADLLHDLVLFETLTFDTPAHRTAMLASTSPPVGSQVHLMGHTRGMTWSYMTGVVSAYREAGMLPIPDKGPWMQVTAMINRGNSGGGAFNEQGELVGLAHSMIPSSPGTCMYIGLQNIKRILE